MTSKVMEAVVVRISVERSCSARLANDILVVFAEPPGLTWHPDDRLRFTDLQVDALVSVVNVTQGHEVMIAIASHDVHDLRIPAGHGNSRTPSRERLHAP